MAELRIRRAGRHGLPYPGWPVFRAGSRRPTHRGGRCAEADGILFPARRGGEVRVRRARDRAPVTVKWFEGATRPPRWEELGALGTISDSGLLFIGDKGKIFDSSDKVTSPRLIPDDKMRELAKNPVAQTLPRIPEQDHFGNFLDAIAQRRSEHRLLKLRICRAPHRIRAAGKSGHLFEGTAEVGRQGAENKQRGGKQTAQAGLPCRMVPGGYRKTGAGMKAGLIALLLATALAQAAL